MDNSHEVLVADVGNGEVRLTINRPHKHNALSRPVLTELARIIQKVADDPQVRIVLLQGAGERYFAAGGDLRDLAVVRTDDATKAMSDEARGALDAIRTCKVPVIAYLNGDAIGGGAELAMACDMRLFAATARLGYIQAKLAITAAWGGGADLFNLVGPSRALRMMARCEMVDATTAEHWGLADAVISDGPHGNDITEFLEPMLRRPPHVMRAIKRQAVACRTGVGYDRQREIEQQDLIATWTHDDHWAVAEHILSKESK